ncbi:MAG TPA: hypothetical protein VGP81_02725 [Pyrinomonadaceae bacterium]|jgi:hypothetical protein|nr:hypothetical protein [Pyrinomonadaceae bacterium]
MALAHHPLPEAAVSSETTSSSANPELARRYQKIADNSRYGHFTRIPGRIVRFLDSLHIDFDREAVHERLLAHYLFIALVDDAIDSGEADLAQAVLDRFNQVACSVNKISPASDVAIVIEMLNCHIEDDSRTPILRALRRAHREVVRERAATSVGTYISHRKALGRATARQSYLLIETALSEPNQNLCRLMEEIGAVGCLVDSVIDIGEDHRLGLLNFDLTAVDYGKLCFSTGIAGVRLLVKAPSLVFQLAEAILDNVRDRGRSRPSLIPQATSSRQSTAQSFRDNVAHPL